MVRVWITCEVGADEVQEELGWVGVDVEGVADAGEVGFDLLDWTEVACSSAGEEEELVEELEGAGGWLVDACDDKKL